MLESILKPERPPISMKSIFTGLISSRSFGSTRKVNPLSSKTTSSVLGSSRAIPSDGPDQPPSKRAMRMGGTGFLSLRADDSISAAFSVTSNMLTLLFRRAEGIGRVETKFIFRTNI